MIQILQQSNIIKNKEKLVSGRDKSNDPNTFSPTPAACASPRQQAKPDFFQAAFFGPRLASRRRISRLT
jgi:hypothetical protein